MKHIKSYNFWIRLVSVVVLLLRVIGAELGFTIDTNLIIDVATIVASVLVVLGVIQVPTEKIDDSKEDENNIGGEFMMSFEKIKQDIITAKEKLVQNFEENETLKEITQLLDDILGSDITGTIEKDFSENRVNPEEVVILTDASNLSTQTDENGENSINLDNNIPTSIITDENQPIYNDKEIPLAEELLQTTEIKTALLEQSAICLNAEADDAMLEKDVDAESLNPVENETVTKSEVLLPNDKEEELRLAIKNKIRTIFESEIDEIITQIFA